MENRVSLLDTRWLEQEDVFRWWYEHMPEGRKKKIDRFRFAADRRLSLGAGILLSCALARENLPLGEVAGGPHGKPFLKGQAGFHFNLSHAGRLAACAVSGEPVGIDVEAERPFEEALVRTVFHDREAAWARECPEGGDAGYTALWTVKESLMKYLGTGLSLEPKRICVDMGPPVRAAYDGLLPGGLFFTRYALSGYQLTVCSPCGPFSARAEWVIPGPGGILTETDQGEAPGP